MQVVKVRLLMLTTENGGRQNEVRSTYRPGWTWDPTEDERLLQDVMEEREGPRTGQIIEPPVVPLGVNTDVYVAPLVPEAWTTLEAGVVVFVHEGLKVVGRGVVLEPLASV